MKIEERYKTILAVCGLFIVIFLLSKNILFIYLAVGLALLSFLSKSFADLFNTVYWKLVHLISKINSTILLTIIFGILIIPYNFFIRIFRKKLLQPNKDNAESYFIQEGKTMEQLDLENPF